MAARRSSRGNSAANWLVIWPVFVICIVVSFASNPLKALISWDMLGIQRMDRTDFSSLRLFSQEYKGASGGMSFAGWV